MTEENIRQDPVGATIQLSAMVRDQGILLEELRQRDARNQNRITASEAANELLNRTIQTRVNKDITESKPINNLEKYGGTEQESFRQWSGHLSNALDRLRPGARKILNRIEMSDAEEWDAGEHELEFSGE